MGGAKGGGWKPLQSKSQIILYVIKVVVSNVFFKPRTLGKWSNLTKKLFKSVESTRPTVLFIQVYDSLSKFQGWANDPNPGCFVKNGWFSDGWPWNYQGIAMCFVAAFFPPPWVPTNQWGGCAVRQVWDASNGTCLMTLDAGEGLVF